MKQSEIRSNINTSRSKILFRFLCAMLKRVAMKAATKCEAKHCLNCLIAIIVKLKPYIFLTIARLIFNGKILSANGFEFLSLFGFVYQMITVREMADLGGTFRTIFFNFQFRLETNLRLLLWEKV